MPNLVAVTEVQHQFPTLVFTEYTTQYSQFLWAAPYEIDSFSSTDVRPRTPQSPLKARGRISKQSILAALVYLCGGLLTTVITFLIRQMPMELDGHLVRHGLFSRKLLTVALLKPLLVLRPVLLVYQPPRQLRALITQTVRLNMRSVVVKGGQALHAVNLEVPALSAMSGTPNACKAVKWFI